MHQLKKVAVSLLLVAFGLLVSLLAVEICFRLIARMTVEKAEWSDRPQFYFQSEESATLQDYSYPAMRPTDTFRIGVVGDSYTFAPYMQFTDSFPKVLERMLNLNKVPLRAEVINYGVPAYSTSHEIATASRAIKEQSNLLILQITLNDPELKPYRPLGIRGERDKWAGLYNLGSEAKERTILKHWKSLAFVLTRLHNEATRKDYTTYFIDLFQKQKPWNNFKDSINSIVKLARTNNVPIVAVVFPLFGLPLDDKYPFKGLHDKVNDLLAANEVPHLDLFEAYRGAPLERIQAIPNQDRHPNEIAHRIAAEKIYSWLEENKFIPDELKIRKRFKQRTRIIKEEPYP